MKNISISKYITVLVFLLISTMSFAQLDEADDEVDGENEELNPAPIEDYIVPMLLVGVYVAFRFLKKEPSRA